MNVKELVAQMTLEEKASLCSGLDFWHTKPIERLGVPAMMVSDGPHGLRKQDMEADHLGVNESIKAVCYPPACASAASFDRAAMQSVGEAIGDACQHENLGIILGPAVCIKRSPLCGRNFEYFSEDPFLAGEMAAAHIHGVQSKNIGTSIKHFAANSQEKRRMTSDSQVDVRTLREIYFPAFETAVKKEQPWSFMCSYNKLNGTYASENKWLLTKILRDEWGFENFVMSDWGAVSDRVKGVEAGLELEMPSSNGVNDKRIVEAVKNGTLDEAVVDQAAERILNIVYRYTENAKPETVWDKEAQHLHAAQVASECMVLLKNEEKVLPLNKNEKVAFVGEFAVKPRYQGGGSSHINSFKVTSAMDAVKEAGIEVTYAQGYDVAADNTTDALIAEAVEAAKNADKVVVFAGLPDAYESEGYDRKHMSLPVSQNAVIDAVAAANPNTIIVLYNGSPVEMPWVNNVKGILEGYLGGQAVGIATVNILYGEVNPSGRLPETFPIKLSDNPSYLYYGGEKDTVAYPEGIFVGYRYYDIKDMDVLFPFGYGLSYTTFEYSDLKLDKTSMKDTDTLKVSVKVTNTGDRAGKTVVQLYVGDDESTVKRPVRELKGFEKVALEAGETKEVTFELDKRSFAYWNEDLYDWHVESGDFTIYVGQSSRDLDLCAKVNVESTVYLPINVTMDTAVMDILADPRAKEIIAPIVNGFKAIFGGGDASASSEAINDEMTNAMLYESPIRTALNWGLIPEEQFNQIMEELKKL